MRDFTGTRFRHVFIVESRAWFDQCRAQFDPALDLVLTNDFGLKREIETIGGAAEFLDHLVDPVVMEENNSKVYAFFRDWHKDSTGRDLFEYRGVPFGFSFRIDFWNDLVYQARTWLCLQVVQSLRADVVYAGTALGIVERILTQMEIAFVAIPAPADQRRPVYAFPIHAWTAKFIRHAGWRARVLELATLLVAFTWTVCDRLVPRSRRRPLVFVHTYTPTQGVVTRLMAEQRVRVMGLSVTRQSPWLRYVPQWRPVAWYEEEATRQMAEFRTRRVARLVLTTGRDITDDTYAVIESRVEPRVAPSLRTLDSVVRYLDRHPLALAVLISNIGEFVAVLDCVCRARGIPTYLIINGLLGPTYLDEGKYATVINAYSRSIQQHYFRGMDNTIALGDPRMDAYPPVPRKPWPTEGPGVVVIGASGHNNIDLNSYVAVEFDFLHDVLRALAAFRAAGASITIVIKVRPNGYLAQYRQFADEYFPGLVDEIVDAVPMRQVLARANFFVSIYSQTLFEASCMGVPCAYYRKDNEVQPPPFDGRSALVILDSVEALVEALGDARAGGDRWDGFLNRAVMEEFVGPLDGKNLQRNLAQVYEMSLR
jgi:hypothetical protein